MKRMQSFKYELKLSGVANRLCSRFAGACRYIYNYALALQISQYETENKKLNYTALCKVVTSLRQQPEKSWLKEIHSQILQQSLKDLDRAYKNFFVKRAAFPRFKRKGIHDAFRFPQGCKLDQKNSRIYLPKIGWTRYRNSREVLGEISNVTISRSGEKWYVSIQTEREVQEEMHSSNTAIGIDVGVAKLATLSDGSNFPAVNSFAKYQKQLAKMQRKTSKQDKFSSNWKKAVYKIGRLHRKVAHIRQNYLHQTTNTICKNHALVFVEDLQIKNMTKSASGSKTNPGKNVRAKSGLNRAILDQGWFEFRRQLEYKQAWRGGVVVAVSPRNTSRTCPDCGNVCKDNRQTQAQFCCVNCGYANNADVVGAINILRAGHARLACGEMVQLGHSMNQEPTEVTQVFAA